MNPERLPPPARRPAPPATEAPITGVPPDERPTLERVWTLLDAAAPASTTNAASTPDAASPPDATDIAWAALADRLGLDADAATADAPLTTPVPAARSARDRRAPSRSAQRSRQARRARRRWPALAMGVAALIAVVLVWPRTVTHTAAPGEQHTVQLPDGSTVHLNSGAQIAYAQRFDRLPLVAAPTRTVRLRGEAFFEVTPAETAGERSFVVETFNARVEVLGTRFNVRAWPSGNAPTTTAATTVTVEEGSVAVTRGTQHGLASHDGAVRLAAGDEAAVYADATAPIAIADDVIVEQTTAWRRDGLAFRNVPLAEVVAELERRYAVTIRLDPALAASTSLVYYRPTPSPLRNVLDDLGRVSGFQYRATSEGYALFADAD